MSHLNIPVYHEFGLLITAPLFFLAPILEKRKKPLFIMVAVIGLIWLILHYRRDLICSEYICFQSLKLHVYYLSFTTHFFRYVVPYFELGLIFKILFHYTRIRKYEIPIGLICYLLCIGIWVSTTSIRSAAYLEKQNELPDKSCNYDDKLQFVIDGQRFLLPSIEALWFEPDNENIGQNPNWIKFASRGWVESSYKMSGPAFLRKFCDRYFPNDKPIKANAWRMSFVLLVNDVWKERYTSVCNDDRSKLWPKYFCSQTIREQRRSLVSIHKNCRFQNTSTFRNMVEARGYASSDDSICLDFEKIVLANYPEYVAVYQHTLFDDFQQKRSHENGTTYRLSKDKKYLKDLADRKNQSNRGGIAKDEIFITEKWRTPNGDPFAMDCYQLKNQTYFLCRTNFVLKGRIHAEYQFKVSEKRPFEEAQKIYDNVIDFIDRVTVTNLK